MREREIYMYILCIDKEKGEERMKRGRERRYMHTCRSCSVFNVLTAKI